MILTAVGYPDRFFFFFVNVGGGLRDLIKFAIL